MAGIKSARGLKLVLKVGDGGSPEVFTGICSINAARGITFSSSSSESPDIQCDDAEAMSWVLREKDNLTAAVTGAGTLNTPDIATMYDWYTAQDPKNCQIVVDVPSADGGVIFEGAFHLTEFGITGDRGAKQEASLTLASDGEVAMADNT